MGMTGLEKKALTEGDKKSVARALMVGGAQVSVMRVIAEGDTHALMKATGATGAIARMIGAGDDDGMAANVMGLIGL